MHRKTAACLMAFFIGSLAMSGETAATSPSQPLRARLIRLEVDGPPQLARMIENFLTERGAVLVDDDQVPTFTVVGTREIIGPARDCKVSYHITRAVLRLPDGGMVYSFPGKSAYDHGPRDQAEASALYLLKAYLGQDRTLVSRLDEVAPGNYYVITSDPDPGDRRLEEIERKVARISTQLAGSKKPDKRADPPPAGLETLMAVATEQKEIRMMITDLSQKIQAGNAAASEKALLQISSKIEAAERCAPERSQNLGAVAAVLIRVPLSGSQRLVTGDYRVCDEASDCLYQQTEDQAGVRVVGSMTRLRQSSAGEYFRSGESFLQIEARRFVPAQRQIVVSDCDADILRKIGRVNREVFTKGRVFIVAREPESD